MNLATKVIVDSQDCDTGSVLELIARWRAEGHVIADLEWTRLTRVARTDRSHFRQRSAYKRIFEIPQF